MRQGSLTRPLCFVWVVTLLLPSGARSQNLILNGSFEQGPDPGSSTPLDPGSTAISGWVVTRGQIDYVGAYWRSSQGARSVDLVGSPGLGGIKQRFPTTPGRQYLVTFDLAGNPDPPAVKSMRVAAAGDSKDFSFTLGDRNLSNLGWVKKTWTFTATESTTTLEFYTLDVDPQETAGAAVDNVSVVLVTSAFQRGDSNGDGQLNIADPIATLNFLFGSQKLSCLDAADVNDDGKLNVTDAIGILGYLFLDTLPPQPPFGSCGQDPNNDELACDTYRPCQ